MELPERQDYIRPPWLRKNSWALDTRAETVLSDHSRVFKFLIERYNYYKTTLTFADYLQGLYRDPISWGRFEQAVGVID